MYDAMYVSPNPVGSIFLSVFMAGMCILVLFVYMSDPCSAFVIIIVFKLFSDSIFYILSSFMDSKLNAFFISLSSNVSVSVYFRYSSLFFHVVLITLL